MRTAGAKISKNLVWAIARSLNLVGAIGRRVARELANKPQYKITIVNAHTGEIIHEANNVSPSELNKVLEAMRTLKGPFETKVSAIN